MRVEDVTIEVRDGDLNRLAVVPANRATFYATGVRNGVGSWSLTLAAEDPLVAHLSLPGAGIIVSGLGPDPFSGPVVGSREEDSADDPRGLVTYEGVTDDVILADRLAFPQPSNANAATQSVAEDTRTGDAESVIHAYVDANVGPSAPSARRESRLVMGPNLARGETVTKSARFEVLGELIGGIADAAGLNFRVVQRNSVLRFETDVTRDVSAFVRLSIEGNTLASHATEIASPGVTRAIVAGKGEGANRKIVEHVSSPSEESRWRRRIERFVEAGSTNDEDELATKADELFAKEGFTAVNVGAVPMDDTAMIFGKDWLLGDRVTVVTNGVESQSIVSGFVFAMDASGVRLGAVLGDLSATSDGAALAARIDQATSRISVLERRLEVTPNAAPTGMLAEYLGEEAPDGWLLCQGQAVSRAAYPALFAVLGTRYGRGDGSTTFNLPDLRKRVPVGFDPSDADFDALGKKGGKKEHTLTIAEMPAHNHGGSTASGGAGTTGGSGTLTTSATTPDWRWYESTGSGNVGAVRGYGSATSGEMPNGSHTHTVPSHTHSIPSHTHGISSQGGNSAHSLMQPYLVVNFIVKT